MKKLLVCFLCVYPLGKCVFASSEEFEFKIERISIYKSGTFVQIEGQKYPLLNMRVSWETEPDNYFSKKKVSGDVEFKGNLYEIEPIILPKIYPHTLLEENKVEEFMGDGWYRVTCFQILERPDGERYERERFFDQKAFCDIGLERVSYRCNGIDKRGYHRVSKMILKGKNEYILYRFLDGEETRKSLLVKESVVREQKMLKRNCDVCRRGDF